MTDKLTARRAERKADREFSPPLGRACEKEARDGGAGDMIARHLLDDIDPAERRQRAAACLTRR